MRGIYTALVTPFTGAGAIDWKAFDRLIEQQRAQGVTGLVICGTTAETPTLSREEKRTLLQRALARASDLELIAGTGTNDTVETVEFTREVAAWGYSRFLVVTPYYNKPSQRGMIAHFEAVADAVRGEIILYNVPGRTGVSLTAKTVAHLAAHPRIRALKEASGNLELLAEIRRELQTAGKSLHLLSGDDATFLGFLRGGGVGTISVASHLLARPMREILETFASESATKLAERCQPLFRDLFIDSNPVPVKFCLAEGKQLEEHVRLPLVTLTEAHRQQLREDLGAWRWDQGSLR